LELNFKIETKQFDHALCGLYDKSLVDYESNYEHLIISLIIEKKNN